MSSCAECQKPLVLEFDDDDREPDQEQEVVPDDVELPCGCHFHWQCLMDQAAEVAVSLKCPSCQTYLPTNQAGPSVTNTVRHMNQNTAILARYHNEGGVQEGHDILPSLTEEAYLSAHPEARPARALLTMCTEGDILGILELIQDVADDEEGLHPDELLRYQDPLAGNKSALHIAVENNQEEVFFLFLFLASGLPYHAFPANVLLSAEQAGLQRPEQTSQIDIRALEDNNGATAEVYASQEGGTWSQLVDAGVFSQWQT